jgi:hypothetical protein
MKAFCCPPKQETGRRRPDLRLSMCSARGDAGGNGVVRRDCELRSLSSVRASGVRTNGVLLQAAEVGWANQERSVAGALRLDPTFAAKRGMRPVSGHCRLSTRRSQPHSAKSAVWC